MVLDSLLELVETLRKRIEEHGASLRQSEALTRAALINPLLRELGWDTENPALVMPEYRLGRGYADYALLKDGKPVIMVEAKKLGNSLQDAASQGIGYCIEDGIGYFAVTDGRLWEIYETHKMAPIAEKLTVQFDLSQSPPITCLKAMALWRPAVEHGSVMAAEAPLVGLKEVENNSDVAASVTEAMVKPQVASVSDTPMPRPTIQHASLETSASALRTNDLQLGEWMPIKELAPEPNSKPSRILFPDGSDMTISSWVDVSAETVRWLSKNRYLNKRNCPIRVSDRAKRYILSDTPIHSHGERFHTEHKVGDLYLEGNYSGPNHVLNSRLIIEHVGLDSAQFKVRLR